MGKLKRFVLLARILWTCILKWRPRLALDNIGWSWTEQRSCFLMSLRSSSSSRERNKYGGICCELSTRSYSAISMSVARGRQWRQRHRKTRFWFGSTSSYAIYANRCPLCRRYYVSFLIWNFIIHQIFSLARDWSERVTWANIPQLKLGNIRGYSPIFKTDGQ